MSFVVVDTNVLLVANAAHQGVSPECVLECIDRLNKIRESGVVVIDDDFRILTEYQNKTSPRAGKGVGDVFLKWLLQTRANGKRVQQVSLTETQTNCFSEFPCPDLEPSFDPPDRKFAAVAAAHPNRPPVLQAADCKWVDWWPQLDAKGVKVIFLCRDDVCRFYSRKYPRNSSPKLP